MISADIRSVHPLRERDDPTREAALVALWLEAMNGEEGELPPFSSGKTGNYSDVVLALPSGNVGVEATEFHADREKGHQHLDHVERFADGVSNLLLAANVSGVHLVMSGQRVPKRPDRIADELIAALEAETLGRGVSVAWDGGDISCLPHRTSTSMVLGPGHGVTWTASLGGADDLCEGMQVLFERKNKRAHRSEVLLIHHVRMQVTQPSLLLPRTTPAEHLPALDEAVRLTAESPFEGVYLMEVLEEVWSTAPSRTGLLARQSTQDGHPFHVGVLALRPHPALEAVGLRPQQ